MLMNTYTLRTPSVFRKGSRVYHRLFGNGIIKGDSWKEGNYGWLVEFKLDGEVVDIFVFESNLYPEKGKCYKCGEKKYMKNNDSRVTAKTRKIICKKCIKSEKDLLA